jgi:hypothetical protein
MGAARQQQQAPVAQRLNVPWAEGRSSECSQLDGRLQSAEASVAHLNDGVFGYREFSIESLYAN